MAVSLLRTGDLLRTVELRLVGLGKNNALMDIGPMKWWPGPMLAAHLSTHATQQIRLVQGGGLLAVAARIVLT